jgi:hypothetical protein
MAGDQRSERPHDGGGEREVGRPRRGARHGRCSRREGEGDRGVEHRLAGVARWRDRLGGDGEGGCTKRARPAKPRQPIFFHGCAP